MRHFITVSTLLLFGLHISVAKANNGANPAETLETEITQLKVQQTQLKSDIKFLSAKSDKAEARLYEIQAANKALLLKADSLQTTCYELAGNQKTDKTELSKSIGTTNQKIQTTDNALHARTLWGICGLAALLIAVIAIVFAFLKKFKKGNGSINEVRKAQESLQAAQTKMQEESVKLDNQLLDIVQKQFAACATPVKAAIEPDHSLALKVADEIVRIELNMSRMDSSIKGYKQLAKAVERIKDNFKANGYEIVNMLGKPYNEGMKVAANFVTDDDLEEGKQIITGITKPQINYNGKMIQAAQITVSQNI